MPFPVLIIENTPLAPAGLFGDWLAARGGRLTTLAGPSLDPAHPAIAEAALIVVLGSPAAAYDGDAWIGTLRGVMREAIEADRAVIGICFGAQMIASAIGGGVSATGTFHYGWKRNVEAVDPLWLGPWPRWHGDHVALPEGVEVLARAEDTIQAFQHRRALGVQFHPEAHAGCLADWIAKTPEGGLEKAGLSAGAIMEETRRRVEADRAARETLFEEMLRRVGF